MTLTPHEVAVSQLSAGSPGQPAPQERIKSLRFIKNNIIGNKTKKDLYIQLGIVSRYTSFFNHGQHVGQISIGNHRRRSGIKSDRKRASSVDATSATPNPTKRRRGGGGVHGLRWRENSVLSVQGIAGMHPPSKASNPQPQLQCRHLACMARVPAQSRQGAEMH